MKFNDFESATLRTVSYENINNISTLQFDCFDDALEHLRVVLRVLMMLELCNLEKIVNGL